MRCIRSLSLSVVYPTGDFEERDSAGTFHDKILLECIRIGSATGLMLND
jgi:hypothetical protein